MSAQDLIIIEGQGDYAHEDLATVESQGECTQDQVIIEGQGECTHEDLAIVEGQGCKNLATRLV